MKRKNSWLSAVFFLGLLTIVGLVVYLKKKRAKEPNPTAPSSFSQGYFPIMGTYISVQTHATRVKEAVKLVKAQFVEVDQMMSEWKPGSPLAAVNQAAGKAPVVVPKQLFALLQRSLVIGQMTEGAFDISWAALWGLWKFKGPQYRVPTSQEIAEKRQWVDYRKVKLDPTRFTAQLPHASMKLGLGGIAKGYALDSAASALRKVGIRDFMISAGGHVVVSGQKAGKQWRVGIRDPRGAQDDAFAILELTDTSVSTSGDYERFFFHKGKRYHHILDPRTGMPTQGVRSATVISADATLADALSTALMVMNPQKGLALIRKTPNAEALLIDNNGQLHLTEGLKQQLHIIHSPR